MRIVVIGGSGFIGSAFIRYAKEKEADIVCCDYGKPDIIYNNVRYITLLYETMDFYRILFEEGDIVILLKWKGIPATCIEVGKKLIENNIVGTMVLIDACIEKRVKKIIFASSGGAVYGNQDKLPIKETAQTYPISLYAVQKLMVEDYLSFVARTRDMEVIILRISNPYGPGQRPFSGQGVIATYMACSLLGKEAEIWGDGNCVRDYLYINDLAQCIYICAENDMDSGIYNVGSGVGTSIFDVCSYIETIIGKKVNYIVKNAGAYQVKNNVLDCMKIEHCTGWKAHTHMESGLRKLSERWNGINFRWND